MATSAEDPELEALLVFVRDQRLFDFTGYKRASLARRVQRRIDTLHLDGVAAYQRRLVADPDEFAALFDSVLINVTSFFRDELPWRYLADQLLPALLDGRPADDTIRVWCAGCASGEEAYTLAILLAEAMGDDERFRSSVKIYATDVDDDALRVARLGSYPASQVHAQVDPALAARYFDVDGAQAVFRKDLRRSLIFGRHDLVQDPPISRIDLLTCRNTLMYFTGEGQGRIVHKLHFALKPTGHLVLGRSESLVSRSELFTPVDLPRRIFTKVPLPSTFARRRSASRPNAEENTMDPAHPALRDAAFHLSPVAQVVLDASGGLAGANQAARTLLGLADGHLGQALSDLQLSYRPFELRSRVDTVMREHHQVVVRGVRGGDGFEHRWFDVVVDPLRTGEEVVGASVSFVDVTLLRQVGDELERTRHEVESAYEELQSTVEELETTNEELQSTNEELETTNEELQSTNEELETMNEELQSTNEALGTTNDELRGRTDDLDLANGFLEAILTSLQSAVVVVDREMRVKVWNRQAADLWGLRADEVLGEHLMNLDIGLPVEVLRQPVRASLSVDRTETRTEVDTVNRRGRAVRCEVRTAPLAPGGDQPVGAIVVIDVQEAPAASPEASGADVEP